MPSKNFIVAIEIGSSKITGVAGQKNHDGSFTVNAVVKEDSTACVRKGVVYNVDKTVQCITNIISRLKLAMKTDISQVYVGVGGLSIHSVRNVIVKDLPNSTQVTQAMVNEMEDDNRTMQYKDFEIIETFAQEYRVDNQLQMEPAGIECSHLEGNFLNILQRKKHYYSLNNCFDKAGVAIAEMYLAPYALADAVLTDAEKRAGCMLVDLGSETTTVLIYHKSVLRHIAVIPLGGNNITKDIASLQMEESDAEKMKLRYASAFTENSEIDASVSYNIDSDRKVDSRKFIELVEGRIQEIVQNVCYQIPADLADKLVGGIIITGGASNMKNIDIAFRNHSHMSKVRIAKSVNYTIHSSNSEITAKNGMMNTILGLFAKGEINCAGEDIVEQKNMFESASTQPATLQEGAKAQGTAEEQKKTGKVQTAAEKAEQQRRDEEAKKKAEQEELEQQEAEEAAKPKKPTFGQRVMNWFGTFMEPEE